MKKIIDPEKYCTVRPLHVQLMRESQNVEIDQWTTSYFLCVLYAPITV